MPSVPDSFRIHNNEKDSAYHFYMVSESSYIDILLLPVQDLHKFFPCDRLLFEKISGEFV